MSGEAAHQLAHNEHGLTRIEGAILIEERLQRWKRKIFKHNRSLEVALAGALEQRQISMRRQFLNRNHL